MTSRHLFSRTAVVVALLLMTVRTGAADEESTVTGLWLRQLFDVQKTESAELLIHGQGTASVYVNGQRLLRNTQLNDAVRSFQVAELLRSGRNSICVALSADGQPTLSAVLKQHGTRELNQWKTTGKAPPVGWQQTDFNDRDWKASAIPGPTNTPSRVVPVVWQPTSGEPRFSDDGFAFRNRDHVVLLGGTFIERAQQFGHLECALNSDPGKRVTFRNLGWSADTVLAESRGIFDSPEKGYERLIEHVRAEEPDVILMCYGQNEAMSFPRGAAGLQRFQEGLARLIQDLRTTGAEIVLLSPHPLLPAPEPLPSPSRWNPVIAEFSEAARRVAETTDVGFVDLFAEFFTDLARHHGRNSQQQLLPPSLEDHPELLTQLGTLWTDNGMHWNDTGYAAVGPLVAERLFAEYSSARVIRIDPVRHALESSDGRVVDAQWSDAAESVVEFKFIPNSVSGGSTIIEIDPNHPIFTVTVTSDHQGDRHNQLATIDRQIRGDRAVTRYQVPHTSVYDQFTHLVQRKNELYFHRWRPQNITYLFGFRKHEQGNNASEIAQFDPLIADLEDQIHQAKQPTAIHVQIARPSDLSPNSEKEKP